MKKISLLVLCSILLACPAFSDDDNPNPVDSQYLLNKKPDADSDDDYGENAESIYENYGSIYSPVFDGRSKENPNESNYDSQGAGGPSG